MKYTESDFAGIEAQLKYWRDFLDTPAFRELECDRKIMIYAWERTLRTDTGEQVLRTQGMIRGAEVVLTYPQDKVNDLEIILEDMRKNNEGIEEEQDVD